jgi:hypothetical protein
MVASAKGSNIWQYKLVSIVAELVVMIDTKASDGLDTSDRQSASFADGAEHGRRRVSAEVARRLPLL